MDAQLLIRALAQRRSIAHRDGWSREQLTAHRQKSLEELRHWALRRSPFYARLHSGLESAPLYALPAVTKSQLMASFDDVVTDRSLRLDEIERHLRELVSADADPGTPWRGKWRAAATAGTTGVPGVFVWDRGEWATVVASYGRATTWAGIPAGPAHPMRMAVVSSLYPTHQSAVVAASVRSPVVRTLRLDANAPLEQTIVALNSFGPQVLVGYASALRPLAYAQLEGRLSVTPRAVMSASEVLSAGAARTMADAWGRAPFDVYAATETAGIASSCEHGRRHIYDDLVIIEPVDEDGSAVPAGTPGARLLVTVLFSRTVPLIRYELSDRVTLGTEPCPCGRPFGVVEAVDGRAEDTLRVLGATTSGLSAGVVRSVVEQFPVDLWQLDGTAPPGVLRLLVVPHGTELDTSAIGQTLSAHLSALGHELRVVVEAVPVLERTALGKAAVLGRSQLH